MSPDLWEEVQFLYDLARGAVSQYSEHKGPPIRRVAYSEADWSKEYDRRRWFARSKPQRSDAIEKASAWVVETLRTAGRTDLLEVWEAACVSAAFDAM